jgi:hypothetical protein
MPPASLRIVDVLLLKGSLLALFLYIASWAYVADNFSMTLITCTISYAAMLYWMTRQFGLFDARVVFLAVSGLYPFTPIVDIVIAGNEFFSMRNASLTLLLASFLFFGFYAVSSFGVSGRQDEWSSFDVVDNINYHTLIAFLYAAFLLYVALLYRDVGLDIGNRSRSEVTVAASAVFAVTRLGFMVGLLVMVAKLRGMGWFGAAIGCSRGDDPRERWQMVSAAVLVVAFGFVDLIILGDRRFFATFALAALCIVRPDRIPIVAWIALPLFLIGFSLQPLIRNSPIDEWSSRLTERNIVNSFIPANFEFGAFGRIAEDLLSDLPISKFPTYADAFLTLIPQVLYPERPEPIGVWFVRLYHPEVWEIGGGLGFNLVIEALLNLGWAGPLILGCLLGLGFRMALNAAGRHRLFHGLLVFALVFAMRFDMATLIKSVVIVVAMAVAWLVAATRFSKLMKQES